MTLPKFLPMISIHTCILETAIGRFEFQNPFFILIAMYHTHHKPFLTKVLKKTATKYHIVCQEIERDLEVLQVTKTQSIFIHY